tara:strand:+ start:141 stop:296 length:156 start_codon:yes stop_codon:yes gene_type:complete
MSWKSNFFYGLVMDEIVVFRGGAMGKLYGYLRNSMDWAEVEVGPSRFTRRR